ncbi:MAG: hypothetical protein KJ718_05450 [Nanoarchaeota archaeon]|nr:hypothetical protein [Nanoarchaeota archaeon]
MQSKENIIKKIKQKKELAGLADIVVENCLNSYLKKYNLNLKNLSEKQLKIIIKELRAELRLLVGRFQKTTKARSLLDIKKLLKTHSSTSERLQFYPKLRSIIKKLKPKSILDLGCGLNPIALANKNIVYHASDINEDELSLIKEFFKKNKIKGNVFVCDLRNLKTKNNLPKADLCLILKVLDIIGKKHAEEIITKVPCKKLIVSFATRKLSGKKMNHPRRIWFESLLERLNYNFEVFNSDNEVFYSIEKD